MIIAFTPALRAQRTATHVPLALDRDSPLPLYYQLFRQLSNIIETGVLKPGDPLESESSIAERVDLSRPTVRQALSELTARGLILRRRGVGTIVADSAVGSRKDLARIFDDLPDAGRCPPTALVEFSRARSDRAASEALGLPRAARLVYIQRVRSTDDAPSAVLRTWLPPTFAGISVDDLLNQGLHRILRTYGVEPAVAHESVGSRAATEQERTLLRLAGNDPVLTVSRRTLDATGTPVELGEHSYRFDAYHYDASVYAS